MPIPFATSEIVTAAELNELARGHWRKTTAKQVVNTVTETDLLNGEITIDAGAMSTNRMLRAILIGDHINNSGATQAFARYKVKLGATTIIDTGAPAAAWGNSATRFGWRIAFEIANLGAANSQWTAIDAKWTASFLAVATTFTTGEGETATATTNYGFALGGNSSAVDTTAAQALAVTVTLPAASLTLDSTLKFAVIDVI